MHDGFVCTQEKNTRYLKERIVRETTKRFGYPVIMKLEGTRM
jgi:hypothetical protein